VCVLKTNKLSISFHCLDQNYSLNIVNRELVGPISIKSKLPDIGVQFASYKSQFSSIELIFLLLFGLRRMLFPYVLEMH